MNKKIGRTLVTGTVALSVAGLVGLCFSLTRTVEDFKVAQTESVADVVLASAKKTETSSSLPVIYFDQVADPCVNFYEPSTYHILINRTFEWQSCGEIDTTALEQYLTNDILNAEFLPTAKETGGQKLQNRSVKTENFERFFKEVAGKSRQIPSTIDFLYEGSTFSYEQDEFYPLAWTDEEVNQDKKNHLFSLILNVPLQITSDGYEKFTVVADDDTWVYYDDKILLDLGGVHDEMTASFKIGADGKVYTSENGHEYRESGIRAEAESKAVLRIFHADRDSASSVFKLYFENMILNTFKSPELAYASLGQTGSVDDNVNVNDGENADGKTGADGDEIAYAGADEAGFAAPLGESYTFVPRRSNALLSSAIVQITLMSILVFMVAILAPIVYRSFKEE